MLGRTTCLDAAEVRRLLAGTLAEEEEGRLAAHLDGCPGCRQVLDQAAGGPPCTGPATLIDDALRRAMNALKADDRLLSHSAAVVQRQEDTLALAGPTEEELPRPRLGHYQITEILGRGGFGVVFKAFDPALHRFVAVKVLAPQLATSAAARRRFAREGRAAAAVSHEHVVAIHCVEEADGLPYLVMEYVAGISLQERLDRDGVLGLPEILRLGMQIASGLAAAHAQGLVHRDIKPANILLESGIERVKITDFGLARAVDDASLTQSGFLAGTPQYMSPEQARGETVDPRADLFSLGSVLYALCTGRPPFRGDSTLAVLRRVCEEEPPPVRDLNPEVPELLAEVIATLHAKDPAERFASAAEVAELLGRYLAHLQQPARAPLPSLPPRRGRLRQPRRKTGRLGVCVLAVVLLGLAWLVGLGGLFRRAPVADMLAQEAPGLPRVRLRYALPVAGPVLGATFSPAGQLLATAHNDRTVRLWDLAREREYILRGHKARVWSVAFSPDGKTLASAAGDWNPQDQIGPGEVIVWDLATRTTRHTLEGHEGLVFSVAFSPDGKTLASAGWDQTVRLWDPVTGQQKAVLSGHTEPVRFVAWSPDGRTLASGSFDGTVQLWDPEAGAARLGLSARPYKVNCVAFSPDGTILATAEIPAQQTTGETGREVPLPGQVRLWDVASGKECTVLRGAVGKVHAVAFAPDGKTLASGGGWWEGYGDLTLWDPVRGERRSLLGHDQWLECVAFAPDGQTLVSGGGWRGDCSELRVWDVNPPAETTRPATSWPVVAAPAAVRFGTVPRMSVPVSPKPPAALRR
jgi:serine/threonine protein kinase/WD40 repeat protein